ncbi:MAG TPA: phage tail sheath C-terminal domain-containing protein, partial [Coleofasciculaceae cyanobacterium]
LRYKQIEEVYTVVSGKDLEQDINNEDMPSALVSALSDASNGGKKPDVGQTVQLKGGSNGLTNPTYKDGLDLLLNENVQIVLAAGQDESFGDELDAHCQQASTDTIKRDRIAVVGSKSANLDDITKHKLASDRVILVAPGIKFTDATTTKEVTLPGSYAAAAIAGLLAGFSPQISLTNKTLQVGGLQKSYTAAELTQLVQSRVLALEERQGIRVVKGITTSTNTAWTQITTRRIVDYAKYGVRSASLPYIGLLNNDRVRGALKSTIDSFLQGMMSDEMLVNYKLDVSATRAQERQGIVQVTITLQPVFSIDYIKVTMFLE